jgi:hypothetical protein
LRDFDPFFTHFFSNSSERTILPLPYPIHFLPPPLVCGTQIWGRLQPRAGSRNGGVRIHWLSCGTSRAWPAGAAPGQRREQRSPWRLWLRPGRISTLPAMPPWCVAV